MTERRHDAEAETEDVLFAVGDPLRRRILDALASSGSGTATSLAAQLPVSRQAIVKHLAILDRVGLVTSRKLGREVMYDVHPAVLEEAALWMVQLAAVWNLRLHSIKTLAEQLPDAVPSSRGPGR